MIAIAFGDAAAARSVHADGVDLVEMGHRAVLLGEIGDLADRGDVAIHRIDQLEGDQLRPGTRGQRLEHGARGGSRSLWRKMIFSRARGRRMPSIIEAWLSSSERMTQ